MRQSFLIVLACVFLVGGCVHRGGISAATGGAAAFDPLLPSAEEIADRLAAAFEGLDSLVVTERVEHAGMPLVSRAWMTPERMRTDVYREGERIFAMRIGDGRQRECAPAAEFRQDPLTAVTLEYDAKEPGGHGNVFLISAEIGCLFGDLTVNWLDPEVRRYPMLIGSIIRGAAVEGRELVRGRECYVCRSVRTSGRRGTDGFYEFEQVLFVEASTGFVLRSCGEQRTGREPSIIRRRYEYEYAPGEVDGGVLDAALEEAVWDGAWR